MCAFDALGLKGKPYFRHEEDHFIFSWLVDLVLAKYDILKYVFNTFRNEVFKMEIYRIF